MKIQVNVQDACLIKNENEDLSINLCSIQLSARFVEWLYLSEPFNSKKTNKKTKNKISIKQILAYLNSYFHMVRLFPYAGEMQMYYRKSYEK